MFYFLRVGGAKQTESNQPELASSVDPWGNGEEPSKADKLRYGILPETSIVVNSGWLFLTGGSIPWIWFF